MRLLFTIFAAFGATAVTSGLTETEAKSRNDLHRLLANPFQRRDVNATSTQNNVTNASVTATSTTANNTIVTTTATAVARVNITNQTVDSGYSYPEGLVTLLLLHEQSVGPRGTYLEQQQLQFAANISNAARTLIANTNTTSTTTTRKPLKIDWRVFPEGQTYQEYVTQLHASCNKSVTGLFDLVFIESTQVGSFADCLLDLQQWDPKIAEGLQYTAVQNSMVDNRLVSLPIELDYGVLLYNNDILSKNGFQGPPSSFADINAIMTAVFPAERATDNFNINGITGLFAGEGMMANLVEWFYGRGSNVLINSNSEPNVLTLAAAEALASIASWVDNGFIDQKDFGFAPLSTNSYAPVTPVTADLVGNDEALSKFLNGNTMFMRHWAHIVPLLANWDTRMSWGVGPVVGVDKDVNVGAIGGWTVGVYKYSQNPAAAARVAKWLSSTDFQRGLVVKGKVPAIPSRPELYRDDAVCQVLGTDLCAILKSITPSLRPASIAKARYSVLSDAITQQTREFLQTPMTVITYLANLDTVIRSQLKGGSGGNSSNAIESLINSDPNAQNSRSNKNKPPNMEIQLLGLSFVMVLCGVVAVLLRRKALHEEKNKSSKQGGKDVEAQQQEKAPITEAGRKSVGGSAGGAAASGSGSSGASKSGVSAAKKAESAPKPKKVVATKTSGGYKQLGDEEPETESQPGLDDSSKALEIAGVERKERGDFV